MYLLWQESAYTSNMLLVLINEFPWVLLDESSRELCASRRVSWAQAGNPGVSNWALPPYLQWHRHLLTKKKQKKKNCSEMSIISIIIIIIADACS